MLDVKLPKGKYVVAVSGGVDSMALLDILRRQRGIELVAAHVNHGIRPDAGEDEKLVHHYAMSHNMKFVSKRLSLGSNASEEVARKARYEFLRHCRTRFKADFIVTAQHQDDLLETAIINLLRGTGWRGLAPFVATKDVLRPLVDCRKNELIDYAKKHKVLWREDVTNQDPRYLRNYVRNDLLPRLEASDSKFRDKLLRLVRKQQELRRTIESELDQLLTSSSKDQSSIDRHTLIMLPADLGYELLQQAFRHYTGTSLTRQLAEAALLFAKAARAGKTMSLGTNRKLRVTPRHLIVEPV